MSVTPPKSASSLGPAILAEVERVRTSGVLGSSGRLLELFDYLVTRSIEDRSPKEAEIALAVFGKSDRDLRRDDPVARVYVHRLRKRLDDFYLRDGHPGGVRLDIPKGDYRLIASADAVEAAPTQADADAAPNKRPPKLVSPGRRSASLAAAAAIVIAANVGAWALLTDRPATAAQQVSESALWSDIARGERPLLVVVGDYYMFGEYENRLSLKRLIRDFDINSKEELVQHYRHDPAQFDRYSDVALQYLPASAAYALAGLAPIIGAREDVQVVMASELTPDKLKTSDIIYVGLLSGIGALRDPVFSRSHFGFGESFDEIIDRRSGKRYVSEAFRAAPSDTMYRDYGFFSTFRGPAGNRIAIVAGSQDTGVMGVAEKLTSAPALAELRKKLVQAEDFEALFEVKGQKHVNLEAHVLASYALDSRSIWTGASTNTASAPAEQARPK